MTIIELCHLIGIQDEVRDRITEYERCIDFNGIKQEIEQMKHPECWEDAIECLQRLLEPDEDGVKILTCQLHCACDAYAKYEELGISEQVFIATMKFFPRFVQDHKDKHGSYRFVWAWWAVRQLSMMEYRIGELEYEMRIEDDRRLIHIHIPADADLSTDKLRKSYLEAVDFFKMYYPAYDGADMVCSSWLLAPSLKAVLPENSKILRFQQLFDIDEVEEDSLNFMDWVYGSKDIPLEELPEGTTLQRNLKPYLRNNGKIELASGKLVVDRMIHM